MSINKFQFSDVEYARIKGVEIIHVNWEKFCYPACANDLSGGRQCNKKVIEIESGVWRCERCDMSTIEPTYRYTLWCVIFDQEEKIWATIFDTEATRLLAITASELRELSLDPCGMEFDSAIESINSLKIDCSIRKPQENRDGATNTNYCMVDFKCLFFQHNWDFSFNPYTEEKIFQ